MNKNDKRTASLGILGLLLAAAAMAAPVAPTEANDLPDQSAAAAITRAAEKAVRTEPAGSSRTVDLLIELQSKTAGLDFNERARENPGATRPGVVPGVGAAPATGMVSATQNAAGLFGSGAVPMPPPRESTSKDGDWRGQSPNTSNSSYQNKDSRPGDDAAGGGRITLPREIIQWVRENRGLVVGGAVLVLVLLWATSMAFNRRRR